MFRHQALRVRRVRQHGLQEFDVVVVQLFTAIDLLLQVERLWQANIH